MTYDGRKVRQQEFQEKRELLEFTESQLNQLTYEIKEEIKQHTEEVERKVGLVTTYQAHFCVTWLYCMQVSHLL